MPHDILESLPQTGLALRRRLRFAAEALGPLAPRDILDFGCGTGEHLTIPLAGLFPQARVLGVDEHAPSLRRAASHGQDNLEFAQTVPDGRTFDAVVASEVLEHVDNPHALLRSLRGLLRPGGRLVLTVPNGYGCSEIMGALEALCVLCGVLPALRRLRDQNAPPAPRDRDTLASSPHVNFFGFSRLEALFKDSALAPVSYSGRMFLHNFLCSMVLDRSERLAEWNARLGACLPARLVSDWMFVLEPVGQPPAGPVPPYRRSSYERAKGWLSARLVASTGGR